MCVLLTCARGGTSAWARLDLVDRYLCEGRHDSHGVRCTMRRIIYVSRGLHGIARDRLHGTRLKSYLCAITWLLALWSCFCGFAGDRFPSNSACERGLSGLKGVSNIRFCVSNLPSKIQSSESQQCSGMMLDDSNEPTAHDSIPAGGAVRMFETIPRTSRGSRQCSAPPQPPERPFLSTGGKTTPRFLAGRDVGGCFRKFTLPELKSYQTDRPTT